MRIAPTLAALVLLSSLGSAQEPPRHNYKPAEGYVPDAATAIRIAVAVWSPIYGEKHIGDQAPFQAKLVNGVWHVAGSLPSKPGQVVVGGTAVAEISKDDGRVLRVSHGL